MTDANVREALARWVRDVALEDLDVAARDIVERAREPYRAAVDLLNDQSPDAALKARGILLEAAEIGVVPLVEAALDVPALAFALRVVAEAESATRRKAGPWLDTLLSDPRVIPVREPTGVTEASEPAEVRVCDQAFLTLRYWMRPSTSRAELESESARFLAQPFAGRDQAIARLREDRRYRAAFLDEWGEDP